MKIFRFIVSVAIVLSLTFTAFIGKDKINEQSKITAPSEYKGIISLWQIDGFEGGSGSRKQFLLKVAREFEKKNNGVLVMVINHTFLSAKENVFWILKTYHILCLIGIAFGVVELIVALKLGDQVSEFFTETHYTIPNKKKKS